MKTTPSTPAPLLVSWAFLELMRLITVARENVRLKEWNPHEGFLNHKREWERDPTPKNWADCIWLWWLDYAVELYDHNTSIQWDVHNWIQVEILDSTALPAEKFLQKEGLLFEKYFTTDEALDGLRRRCAQLSERLLTTGSLLSAPASSELETIGETASHAASAMAHFEAGTQTGERYLELLLLQQE